MDWFIRWEFIQKSPIIVSATKERKKLNKCSKCIKKGASKKLVIYLDRYSVLSLNKTKIENLRSVAVFYTQDNDGVIPKYVSIFFLRFKKLSFCYRLTMMNFLRLCFMSLFINTKKKPNKMLFINKY